eukprot:10331532-Alexandrium_andersonii.AAC.1
MRKAEHVLYRVLGGHGPFTCPEGDKQGKAKWRQCIHGEAEKVFAQHARALEVLLQSRDTDAFWH